MLKMVEFSDSIDNFGLLAFYSTNIIDSFILSNGSKSIPHISEFYFFNPKRVFLPVSIEKLTSSFFSICKSISELHLLAEDSYQIDAIFNEEDVKDITLFVPIGTGYAYRHHPEFSKFKEAKIERCTVYDE